MPQDDLAHSRLSFKAYVYLFPVAAWVAQTIELFKHSVSYFSIGLAFALFAFIPVEVYVSELWGRAVSPSAKPVNIFLANLIDLSGVFCLTVFYIAYPTLLQAKSNDAEWSKAALLLMGFGGLLVLNFIWNKLSEVRHRQVFSELKQSLTEAGRDQRDRLARKAYFRLISSISRLEWLNYNLFARLFPFAGVAMVVASIIIIFVAQSANPGFQSFAAWFVITFFLLSLISKLLHISMLSYVTDSMDNEGLTYSSRMIEITTRGLSLVGVGNGSEVVDIISRFREVCVLEDMLNSSRYPGTKHVHLNRKFKKSAIALDIWDQSAFHLVSRNIVGDLIGTVRVNPKDSSGLLPFTMAMRDDSVAGKHALPEFCYEISKFYIKPAYRSSLAYSVVIQLIYAAASLIESKSKHSNNAITVYADVFDVKLPNTLSDRCYTSFGFSDTGVRYFDDRYAANSKIFAFTSNGDFSKSIFYTRSKKLYNKVMKRKSRS